ncbi:MAG: M3 family oligoendopeptidase [Christensenellaceae bacterium]|nr:M3 family oligoendopeptidase [Christensenellaceae bacterium]
MQKFSEIEYKRPDIAGAGKAAEAILEKFSAAATAEEAKELFLVLNHAMDEVQTMCTVASIRNTIDLTDEFYAGEMKYINSEFAQLMPVSKKINKAICETPFRKELEEAFGAQVFRLAESQERLITPENIQLSIEESDLCDEFKFAVADCSVDFMGEKCNFYGLLKHMESTDRAERQAAFKEWARLYSEVSPKLDDIYSKLVANRVQQAKNLGFDSYIDMAYLSRGRFDYNAEDAARFRSYVEKYITPFVSEMREKQKAVLGIDELHWYDESLDFPDGNPTPHGTKDEMIAAAQKMYRELSPETGEFFDFMTEYELFDLETRPGKHMGGYCTSLDIYKAPFIFSNFNGTAADVDVLTHEAGHAFEAYSAYKTQQIAEYTYSTSEINEIHSMSMEHFTYPWMDLFFGEDTDRRLYSHLFGALSVIPYLVSVDEFQHRVFEKPDMTAEERKAVWRSIERKYQPWRDYDGNEFLESGGFWMQKQHIFLYPFYYVDYALAQTCAFMYYKRMCEDKQEAWNGYLELCKKGGSLGYFETLESAGLKNPFVEENVKETIEFVKAKVLELYDACRK